MGHRVNLRQGQTDWEVFQSIARKEEDAGYQYGYALGFADGKAARDRGDVDHGDLLSANDPYADGYRAGLNY